MRANGDTEQAVEGNVERGAEEEEEAALLERKKLKREKREARDRSERKSKRRKERENAELDFEHQLIAPSGQEGDLIEKMDEELDQGTRASAEDDIPLELPDIIRVASPIPLEAFPVAAAPLSADPALLSRQGLPKGLEQAEIVDQSVTSPLDELPPTMQTLLTEIGVQRLFAGLFIYLIDIVRKKADMTCSVQSALLPKLMPMPLVLTPYTRLQDYLASAPTGSGKTLAYVLPIVHILSTRVVPRLRAFIVLPTKDLVVQVRETLETIAKGSGLSVSPELKMKTSAEECRSAV